MRYLLFYILLYALPHLTIGQNVVSIKVDGSINPASASFIKSAIDQASNTNAQCLIIHLNTPGGLLKSTRVIVGDILASPVPVVVYVSPGGAHAGSAGVFITMAAHVAAMAPSTNIGAAHPVKLQGSMDSTMSDKTTNDAAAFIRSIAAKRKRNLQWAEEAVRKSVSITEIEALNKHVVDLIAEDQQDLLRKIDGLPISINNGTKILNTQNASIKNIEMNFVERLMDIISDPNIAYILMMLGFYGLLFELYSPGAVAPGVIGGICLILAFYAMHALPLNYAGLALIIFAIILFVLEVKIISHGILGLGGVIALAFGSMMLIKTESALEFIRISWGVILSVTAVTALFFFALVALVVKAQKAKPITGIEGLIGSEGETLVALQPSGTIRIHGELWHATATTGSIDKGQKVTVTSINKLTLFVQPSAV